MNASLRRTLALAAVGLLVWGGWYGWMSWKTSQSIHALKDVVRSADLDKLLSDPPAEVASTVDLAIRDLTLSQGQEGRKSFDLKAKWATLNQDSGDVTIREKYGLKPEEMAYMGDDWIDLDPMRSVGMPIAVANAVAQVKKEARYVTAARGGDGAVREAIEFLLNARLDGKNPADFWTAATGPARI
jgi:hypothetical protein